MYAFHSDGRNARLLGDEPVLFFEDGARRSIAIEAAPRASLGTRRLDR
jgi:hypothetical protein